MRLLPDSKTLLHLKSFRLRGEHLDLLAGQRGQTCKRVCSMRKMVSRSIMPTMCSSEITGIWLMSSLCMRCRIASAGSAGEAE